MPSHTTAIQRIAAIEQSLNHQGFEFAAEELSQFLSDYNSSDGALADRILNIRLQILIGLGKFEELEKTIQQVESKTLETQIRCLISEGILANRKSDYQASLIHFLEAESLAKQVDNPLLLAQVQINIGTVYAGLHHYQEGLDRYALVLSTHSDILSQATQSALLHNLGNLNYAIGDITTSIECLESSIALKNKALVERSQLLLWRSKLAIDPSARLDLSVSVDEHHDLYPISSYCQSFAEADDVRLTTLEKVSQLAYEGNDYTTELDALNRLVDFYKAASNWESAFAVLERLRTVEASLLSKQQAAKLAEQVARYVIAEKEQSIAVLEKEKALQDEIVKRNDQLEAANEELRQFAYVVSHDLKEPLRMIGAYTQIIESGVKNGGDIEEYFSFIQGGVSRLNVLLDGLSNYSTLKSLQEQHEIQNLNSVISSAIENLDVLINETESRIDINADVEVNGSPVLLVLLFQNLIQNAIKFRKEDQVAQVNITAIKGTDNTIIEVSDNGKGIAENQRDRIFIIFQRLSRDHVDGSGMGLAICRKIVQLHEGRIYVKDTPGDDGTTFRIELPN